MENAVFFETITQTKSNVYILPMIFILVIIAALFAGIIFAAKNTSIAIKDNMLVINSFIYGLKIPIENILTNEIKTINLKTDKEYGVQIRTNGIALPGFVSGWMRLKNGKKALVFLTNPENVLLIPTNDFLVMFSMKKTDEFIDKIISR